MLLHPYATGETRLSAVHLSQCLCPPQLQALHTCWTDRATCLRAEISERQKIEGGKEVHKAELRLRMDAAIGRAPPIKQDELQVSKLTEYPSPFHRALLDATLL